MQIILFFMALSAWCAQESFAVPSYWERPYIPQSALALSCVGAQKCGLTGAGILRSNNGKEQLRFSDHHYDVSVTMNMWSPSLRGGGTVFMIDGMCNCAFKAQCASDQVPLPQKGYVFCSPLDLSGGFGYLDFAGPMKSPKPAQAEVSLKNAFYSNRLCAYDAQETCFTVIRFLKEYAGNKRFFVSAELDYNNLSSVVIHWGNQRDGVRQDAGTCCFDFNGVCPKNKQVVKLHEQPQEGCSIM